MHSGSTRREASETSRLLRSAKKPRTCSGPRAQIEAGARSARARAGPDSNLAQKRCAGSREKGQHLPCSSHVASEVAHDNHVADACNGRLRNHGKRRHPRGACTDRALPRVLHRGKGGERLGFREGGGNGAQWLAWITQTHAASSWQRTGSGEVRMGACLVGGGASHVADKTDERVRVSASRRAISGTTL
jgi:hypothetical protein